MTHLRIEQNSNNETVSSTLVHRLYTEAHAGLDSTSNLAGMITVSHCKQSEKNYLENLYPGLTINCSEGYYMDFADPEVERICITNWGDGMGITQQQASNTTDIIWSQFAGNTLITSFDELKYFNFKQFGWSWSGIQGFSGCTNLRSVDYGGKKFGGSMNLFNGCSSLEEIKNFNMDPNYGEYTFRATFNGCTSLHTIDLSKLNNIGERTFNNCTSLNLANNGFDWKNITHLYGSGYSAISGVLGVGDIDLRNVIRLSNPQLNHFLYKCPSVTSITNVPSSMQHSGSYENDWSNSISQCPMLRLIDYSGATFSVLRRGFCGGQLPNLEIIKLPPTLTRINPLSMNGDFPKLSALVLNSNIVVDLPTDDDGNQVGSIQSFGSTNFPLLNVYVPDNLVSQYQSASGWSDISSKIKSMTQYATDFPND